MIQLMLKTNYRPHKKRIKTMKNCAFYILLLNSLPDDMGQSWINIGPDDSYFHNIKSQDDVIFAAGVSGLWSLQLEPSVLGCTDESACNFDAEANSDDGMCVPSGCLDAEACNYNADAECEGEACDYTCCPGPGCCGEGMFWDWNLEECAIANPSDSNFDGCVQLGSDTKKTQTVHAP